MSLKRKVAPVRGLRLRWRTAWLGLSSCLSGMRSAIMMVPLLAIEFTEEIHVETHEQPEQVVKLGNHCCPCQESEVRLEHFSPQTPGKVLVPVLSSLSLSPSLRNFDTMVHTTCELRDIVG